MCLYFYLMISHVDIDEDASLKLVDKFCYFRDIQNVDGVQKG